MSFLLHIYIIFTLFDQIVGQQVYTLIHTWLLQFSAHISKVVSLFFKYFWTFWIQKIYFLHKKSWFLIPQNCVLYIVKTCFLRNVLLFHRPKQQNDVQYAREIVKTLLKQFQKISKHYCSFVFTFYVWNSMKNHILFTIYN